MRHAACLSAAAGLALAFTPAHAQLQVGIDTSSRRQTMEGFGIAATDVWYAPVVALFHQPAFAAQLRDDLGVTMIRIELPPEIQSTEDLDPNTLDLSRFDFSRVDDAGALAANLNQGQPGAVKVFATIWSPPAWMKTNNSITNGGNLRTDRYAHFAKYCAAMGPGFQQRFGVPLYALSPQNEPVFAEPYVSCVYS